MSNSKLIDCTVKTTNHSGKRTHKIDRITPHCVVGQLYAEDIGRCFPNAVYNSKGQLIGGRESSCNYGIGTEGRVCLIVDEANRSWCSSSNANDQRAITIECASDTKEPYAMNTKVYNKLIDLCVDICQRNGMDTLLWFADKDKSLNYAPKANECVLTVHRWFANKSCPGNWLYDRLGEVAKEVTKRLQPTVTTQKPVEQQASFKVGDTLKIKAGSYYVGGKQIPNWVINSTLYYRGTNEKGIIFSTTKVGPVTGVVAEADLIIPKATSMKSTADADLFNSTYAGTYKLKTDANIRNGAGTDTSIMAKLPKDTEVHCYGYYSKSKMNNIWLYVQVVYNEMTYTGFIAKTRLVKK